MALDKSKLQNGIKNIMTDMLDREVNSIDEFSERLASLIDTYVKEAEIVYLTGLTASSYPVTGTFKGNLK